MAFLRSIGTALPEHRYEQSALSEFAATVLPPEQFERIGRVFHNAKIDARYLARPLDWYVASHGHGERAKVFQEVGLDLMQEAATAALGRAGIAAQGVGTIIFVSTTGHSTPSLDARLCNLMPFPPSIRRLPIWGLGCAGGVAGLNRACEVVDATKAPALLINLELCSINLDMGVVLQGGSESAKAAVAAAVFGDGCSAVVVTPDGPGPEWRGGHRHQFPDTEWVMGWDVTDTNLEVVLSPKIPDIVTEHLGGIVAPILAEHGIVRPDAWILHPGGAKVMDAMQDALGLSDDERAWSDSVLRKHGNMSSPTALFCLESYLQSNPPAGQHVFVSALGPGFASESAVLRT